MSEPPAQHIELQQQAPNHNIAPSVPKKYLEKVESLAEEDLYQELFKQHFQPEDDSRVTMIVGNYRELEIKKNAFVELEGWCMKGAARFKGRCKVMGKDWMRPRLEGREMTENKTTRNGTPKNGTTNDETAAMHNKPKTKPRILLVERIGETGIELLGSVLDISPCFFARHLGSSEHWRTESDDMKSLCSAFRNSLPIHSQQRRSSEWSRMTGAASRIAPMTDPDNAKNSARYWPSMGTDRVFGDEFRPRISMYQVSTWFWIILVDPEFGTGASKEMHKLLGFNENLKALEKDIKTVLPMLMALAAWNKNTHSLQTRLERLRHDAMQSPDLETFHPLTILRRNIADLHNGLMSAQTYQVPRYCEAAYERLKADIDDEEEHGFRQTLRHHFSPLLERVESLYKTLDHEVQLVIGAVTVQDSATMKEQSRRATSLTLLAAFYLPMTLVTGIFGMYIDETNNGSSKWWACFAALAVIAGATLVGFGWDKVRRLRNASQEKRRKGGKKTLYKMA